MNIIGFDVSSTCIGFGVIDTENIKLIDYGYIEPPKNKNILRRLDYVFKEVEMLCKKHNVEHIGVEDILLFFKSGKSQASTIITLAIFNRLVGYSAFSFCKNVVFIPVQTIRKIIRIHIKRKEKITKEEMPDLILNHLEKDFKIKTLTKGKNIGKIHKFTYDQADGIAVAWALAIRLSTEKK
jgi:Holliday junction resolvasome RuvABC endonuclease subunit